MAKKSEVEWTCCDLCTYRKRRFHIQERRVPDRWKMYRGMLLCPQCWEMAMMQTEERKSNLAFGYCRSSTTKQGMSLEVQKQRIEAYCEYRGLELAGMYVDRSSASKKRFRTRPAGGALHAAVSEGCHVVMAKYDRGFRNVADCLDMFELWCKEGVHLHFAAENGLVPNTPHGKLIVTLMVAAAEYEAGVMGVRQKETQAQRRRELRPAVTNFPVTGFVFGEVDGKNKKGETVKKRILVVDENERENTQYIYKLRYEENMPLRDIEARLKEERVNVPQSARQYDDRMARHYSYNRIRRLLALESEFRRVKAKFPEKKEWTLKELGEEWQRMYYATGRTRVTLSGNMKKGRPLSDKLVGME